MLGCDAVNNKVKIVDLSQILRSQLHVGQPYSLCEMPKSMSKDLKSSIFQLGSLKKKKDCQVLKRKSSTVWVKKYIILMFENQLTISTFSVLIQNTQIYLKDAMTVEEYIASACLRKNLNPMQHFVRVKKRRDMEDHNYFVPHRSDLIETYVRDSMMFVKKY